MGGIASFGSGGRGEFTEVDMEDGDFWASAAAIFGGSGSIFEKRERPLPGVSGSLKAISTKPAGGLNNKYI